MSKMLRSRIGLLATALVGLAVFQSGANFARAGSLELLIFEDGVATGAITDGGIYDTDGRTGFISISDTYNLNLSFFQFNGGSGADSNATTSTTVATLHSNGSISLLETAAGTHTLQIDATDIDYNNPTGIGRLTSSGGSTFTNSTPGDEDVFKSYFNQSNVLDATETPSPTLTFTSTSTDVNASSGAAVPTGLGFITAPYGLTNITTITLAQRSDLAVGDLVTSQYQGSTQVRATAVPEPASAALLFPAMPLMLMGWLHRRRGTRRF